MVYPASDVAQPAALSLYVVTLRCEPGRAELVASDLFDGGIGGLEERDDGVIVVYTEDADVALLVKRLTERNATVSVEERASTWRTEFTRHFRGAKLTERITICLAGDRPNANRTGGASSTVLELEPAFAFGFGDHASSRLAAGFVEDFCGANPGTTVLDLGSGTGVLGFVALLSGASSITGVDIDYTAVEVARRNAERNGLGARATFATVTRELSPPFDLVVANMEAPSLFALLTSPEIGRLIAPHAVLAVTGFDEAAEPDLTSALASSLGREMTERRTLDGWVLAVFRRRAVESAVDRPLEAGPRPE